jgi:amino acid transporter
VNARIDDGFAEDGGAPCASAAHGPEAALTVLRPLGAAASRWILPLLSLVVPVLVTVSLSYRQTIAAYPDAGGSYPVTRKNLGEWAGLVAAAALFVDYLLNVAVGISAGVGALVSAVPALLPRTLPLTLGILVVITLVELRGPRQSGSPSRRAPTVRP